MRSDSSEGQTSAVRIRSSDDLSGVVDEIGDVGINRGKLALLGVGLVLRRGVVTAVILEVMKASS